MVSLVVVSHSRALAEALLRLVGQISQQQVPIAIAAGIGPEREEFGTDAVEISEAIQSVYSPDGVLVLMDLGSAVISADMALELLPEEMRSQVHFCAAPLVEGTIAAVVQAGLGSDLETVCREAEGALLPKKQHFSQPVESQPAAPPVEALPDAEGMQSVTLTLTNQHGLHARPAARFVQTSAEYDADIRVANLTANKGPVSAKSLNALATLGAVHGHQILITANGPDAEQALQALSRLVEDNFGESTEPPPVSEVAVSMPASMELEGAVHAVPISDGIALGPFYRFQPAVPTIPLGKTKNPEEEWDRLQRALDNTRKSIRARLQQMQQTIGESEAAIFEAHLLILQDPDLLGEVKKLIFSEQENAAAAWNHSIQKLAGIYQGLDDPYLRQRAIDVLDVGNQVLFALAGKSSVAVVNTSEPVILFAKDLTPTETSQLDMSKVLAIVTEGGGPTSHSAILARALGIPSVSGASPTLERLPPGTTIGIDGFEALIWVDPSEEIKAELRERREAWLNQRQRLLQEGRQPACTRDGTLIEVAANIGNVQDARLAIENGADGIGLLRTEFLYLTRNSPPSEDEQVESLRQIGEVMGQRPVIVRTLDVGGDKDLPYIELPEEANPFLGVRAVRLSLRNTDLFLTQLRAILRAGADYNLKVMFPMVANLEEVLQARELLERAHRSLEMDHIPHCWPIETGIMVEIPSAAVLSEIIAPHIDFFSIGTNDLTQYTLAAERGNPNLASLQDAFHPAVLRLIKQVTEAAAGVGKWVGVCGELAGDPAAVPVLVGLGVKELSLNPAGIPRVKEVVRSLNLEEARNSIEKILQADSPASARKLVREIYHLP